MISHSKLGWLGLSAFLAALASPPAGYAGSGAAPLGWQGEANAEFTGGWACDPDNFAQPLAIHVYREGGVFVGATVADLPRPDVAPVCGGQAAHGFLFEYPPGLRDGRTHTIYTYAIDLGGGTNPLLNGSPRSTFIAAQPDELYMLQPSIEVPEIDDRIIGNIHPASETFLVRMGNMGRDADQAQVSWGVASKTGFSPGIGAEVTSYQRGPNYLTGTTAVQLRGKEVGIWMDSATVQLTTGHLLPITPGYWWWDSSRAPRPFAVPGSELSYSLALKIPTAYRAAGGDAYASAYFLFNDVTTGRAFWYGANLFDLRGNLGDMVLCDCWPGGTMVPIVAGPLVPGGRFLHPGAGSATLQSTTWFDYRYFNFRVGEGELRQAVVAIKRAFPALGSLSENPADYRLDHVNFNPELSMPPGSRAQLGLAVRNIKIGVYRKSVYDKVYIRGANAGPAQRLQVFFKTEASNFYSEDKSVTVYFPGGGGWLEVVADMSQNPRWAGRITGLRIDPFNASAWFGIDYVYVGNSSRNYLMAWDFNGAMNVTNPFFGWTLHRIHFAWTNGSLWGGFGEGDPFFHIDTDFQSGR